MATDPAVVGATPLGLREPKGRTVAATIRQTRGRLANAERLTFQRDTLPFLRLLFDGITESQELGAFDAAGIDHLSVTRDGDLDTVVQCKGFAVTPAEVGSDQAEQCLKSISKFRRAGRKTNGYLLLHNRDHRNPAFYEPVQESLAALRQDGLAAWVSLWSSKDLIDHVDEEMVRRLTQQVARASEAALADTQAILAARIIETVPFVRSRLMAHRGILKPVSEPRRESSDPVMWLQRNPDEITVVTGSFGFGKTTVAVRAAAAWGKGVLFVPGARIGAEGTSNLRHSLLNGIAESTLATVCEEDRDVLASFASLAAKRLLRLPDQSFALILDGLDESPLLGSSAGLGGFLQSLRNFRVPILITVRSEVWNAHMAELSAGFSDQAPSNTGRTIYSIDMGEWSQREMLAFLDASVERLDPSARAAVAELRALIAGGDYETYYGDVPRRPLFLGMIVDDAIAFGLRGRNRVELVDDWMMQKLIRDFQGPVAAGGSGRVGLLKAGSRLDDQLRMARSVMALAARHMLAGSESGPIELMPFVPESELRAILPMDSSAFDLTGLVTNSLLIPAGPSAPGRPVRLRFAHRLFQEYLLAESLVERPDTRMEPRLPGSVRDWIERMRAARS